MEIETIPVRERIRTMMPSLQTAEKRVAEYLLRHMDGSDSELTVSAVAQGAGSSTGTVVRPCRSLGYRGYQQLHVLIARDRLVSSADDDHDGHSGRGHGQSDCAATGPELGAHAREQAKTFAKQLSRLTDTLSSEDLGKTIALLKTAKHILIIANGLSAPIGVSLMSRLLRNGFDVAYFNDAIDQHIAAKRLSPKSLAFVISGSGLNSHTLAAVKAAKNTGAKIAALTCFGTSLLTSMADVSLIAGSSEFTFDGEIVNASRIGLMMIVEVLAMELARGCDASSQILPIISEHLADTDD